MKETDFEVYYPELLPHPTLGNPPALASYPPSTQDIWNGMYWRYRVFQHQRQHGSGSEDDDEDLADAIAYANAVVTASIYAMSSYEPVLDADASFSSDTSADSLLSVGPGEANASSSDLSFESTTSTDYQLNMDNFQPKAFFNDLYSSIMSQAQLFRRHVKQPEGTDRSDIVRLATYNTAAIHASLLLYPVDRTAKSKTQSRFPMEDDGTGKYQTVRAARYAATVATLTLEAYETFPRPLTLRDLNHAIHNMRGYGLDEAPKSFRIQDSDSTASSPV